MNMAAQKNDTPQKSEREQALVRTCVGCRRTEDDRTRMIRWVWSPEISAVVPEFGTKLPGRGAWTHLRAECIGDAARGGGFSRAFKVPVNADARALTELVRAQLERRAGSLLLAAHRRRIIAIGAEATREAIRAGKTHSLLVAHDAGGVREDLVAMQERLGGRLVLFGTKERIGGLFGRESVAVLAILDAGIGEALVDVIEAQEALERAEPTAGKSKKKNSRERRAVRSRESEER